MQDRLDSNQQPVLLRSSRFCRRGDRPPRRPERFELRADGCQLCVGAWSDLHDDLERAEPLLRDHEPRASAPAVSCDA